MNWHRQYPALLAMIIATTFAGDRLGTAEEPARPEFPRRSGSPDVTAIPEDPRVDPSSTDVLLRGYGDAEYADAQQAVPRRPEPVLGQPVPRTIQVTGTVFLDRNGDGVCAAGEPGLPGALVSDGETARRTGRDGSFGFQFDLPDEPHSRFVMATRPTGYRPTRLTYQTVRFDETATQYRAEFGFVEDPPSRERTFWFIAASDSQFNTLAEMITIAKDYRQVTSATGNPAFLLTAGDLTQTGSHHEWDMYDVVRASSHIDVYDGFGGHDGNCLSPRGTANYELRIGPPYYSWDYGGVHFIQSVSELPYLMPKARARQQKWIDADLKAIPSGMPVIIVSHYPLAADWFDRRKEAGTNILCQVAAHWHYVMVGSRRGIPVMISAPARGRDWGAYSRTYRWVYVTPTGITSSLRVAGQYRRLELLAPAPSVPRAAQPLVALAYDTARIVDDVRCRLTDPDGHVSSEQLTAHGDWSWHGAFDPHVPGRWTIELEAIGVTGTVWTRTRTTVVEGRRVAAPVPGPELPSLLVGAPPRCLPSGPRPPLAVRWVRHTGSVHVLHSSPVTSSGRVYVAVTNPNAGTPGSGVLCLDAGTGAEIWRAASPKGDLRGTLTVHGGRVFAVTGEGWAAAHDASTGVEIWSRPLRPDYRFGRPLAINQTVPIPTPAGLLVSDWQKPQYLLDYSTGKERARIDANVGYYASFATVFDNVLYTARRGGAAAYRLSDSMPIWTAEESSRSTSAAIVAGGKLLYSTTTGLKALDAATGKTVWHTAVPNMGNQKPIPVVWDDLVLVNGTDLVAVDLQSGRRRWAIPCGRDARGFVRSRRHALAGSSTPLVVGDSAYFGHDDTSVRAVNRAGNVVWEYRLGTPIKTAPALSGNLLFVHDFAGNLWCFEGRSS